METFISVRSAFCHESENGACYLLMEYLDVSIIDSPFFFGVTDGLHAETGSKIKWIVIAKKIKRLPETIFGAVVNGR